MVSIKMGAKAIPFTLTGTDDKKHSLSDYKDKKAVAVIFSCNHCPYVKAWEDRMVQIQREYGPKGAQLVVINANDTEKHPDDSFPKMKERAREKGFNFPYLIDTTQEVARAYGAERTPEIFLFDKSGALRYHGAIDDNYEDAKAVKQHWFRSALDAVLAGKEPATKDTKAVGCTIKWK
jgi:peroxiredoxin